MDSTLSNSSIYNDMQAQQPTDNFDPAYLNIKYQQAYPEQQIVIDGPQDQSQHDNDVATGVPSIMKQNKAKPTPLRAHKTATAAQKKANAGATTSRTFQACQSCRKTKQKCNDSEGHCDSCLKRGILCEQHDHNLKMNFERGKRDMVEQILRNKVVEISAQNESLEEEKRALQAEIQNLKNAASQAANLAQENYNLQAEIQRLRNPAPVSPAQFQPGNQDPHYPYFPFNNNHIAPHGDFNGYYHNRVNNNNGNRNNNNNNGNHNGNHFGYNPNFGPVGDL